MCTVNWWQIELKKDNKIKIIGNCEWFFKLIKGIPLFQSVSDSIADIFTKEPHLFLHQNLNIIKFQPCGPLTDEKVIQKMII